MPERAPARSIYILILLFLINLMNFFDRTIPAVVLEPIRKEFSLDDTALGILGASFTLIYAVAGVPLGYLADRFRRTYILAAGLTVWSLLTAASGLAWSFMSFFWIRLLVGVGEASCAPAANSLIGDLFPSEKRARALGVFMLACRSACCWLSASSAYWRRTMDGACRSISPRSRASSWQR